MPEGVLRLFFDYGAGGCLWAGDDMARESLGYGPVDCPLIAPTGELSRPAALPLPKETQALIQRLDDLNRSYLNPHYQPDPSLWRQSVCDAFNTEVDRLLARLKQDVGARYHIIDRQVRYAEDPELDAYLAAHPQISAIKDVDELIG